jgi:hypothetical protein
MRSALCFALALAGCTSGSTARGDLASTVEDLAMPLAVDLAPAAPPDLLSVYPAAPYGNTVGSVIPPLVWEGYADPLADELASKKMYGTYSMDDLRRSGSPYGIVHVAYFF